MSQVSGKSHQERGPQNVRVGEFPAFPHDLYLAATAKSPCENTKKPTSQGQEVCRNMFQVPADDGLYGAGSSPFTTNPLTMGCYERFVSGRVLHLCSPRTY